MRIFKIKARHCCLRKWKKREREWKTKLAGIIWRTRFSKICFAGKMEKIHSWEKLDSSIPESGFASQWKSIETSFGLEERKREREGERERESIVSRSLPKCRYSRLVQRCLVLFAISVHSVKRGRSIHETVLAAIFRIPGSTTPPGKFLYSSFRRGTTTISRLFLSFFHYSSISFHPK